MAVTEVDLTAAAALVVYESVVHAAASPNLAPKWRLQSDARLDGVLALWLTLTGLDDRAEALELANQLADSYTPVTAAVPPF